MKPKLVNGFRLWYHGYNGELDDYGRHLLRAKTHKTHWTWRSATNFITHICEYAGY